MSKMFDFVTDTKNPLGGDCYKCVYCYIHGKRGMKKRFPVINNKYSGDIKLYPKIFNEKIKGDLCFFCDCIDYLHPNVSDKYILKIYSWIYEHYHYQINFLSLTKNPKRYLDLEKYLPINMILGSTIESNRNYPELSKAPSQRDRLRYMCDIANNLNIFHYRRFISIEPILDFDIEEFVFLLRFAIIKEVAIGYDNYNHKLPEPSLDKTMELIKILEGYKIKVHRKTLRKAWWEEK